MIVTENKILMDNLSLQAKLKIIVSYFQVMLVLTKVYGVKLHESLYGIMGIFGLFEFSFLIVPDTASCTSSVSNRLIFIALWPFALIAVFIGIVLFYGIASKGKDRLRSSREHQQRFFQNIQETYHTSNDFNLHSNDSHRSIKYDQSPSSTRIRSILGRSAYFIICYIYLILPTIINKIFDAKRCNAFTTDDANKEQNSYLVVDLNVKCESGDFEYVKLQVSFWIFFALWSILVPFSFIYMLRVCRKQLSLNRASPFAGACSFLWKDYDNSMYYWDIVDLYRKLFLTCFVIFIDTEEGSTKIFRLMIGAIVSFTYLAIVAVNDPYERNDDYFLACGSNLLLSISFVLGLMTIFATMVDDYFLACGSNLLLSISFVLGLMTHICNNGGNDTCNDGGCICQSMILSSLNHEKSSFYFVMMNLGVLLLFFIIIAVRVRATIKAPTIKLVRSGTKPNLQMEKGCEYHAFISHVWATGQNQTHTLVRQIQRLLPSMNIWLDVDTMETVGDLEDSVTKSSTFILFLSKGYFKSQNCKRELRAAFELNKPLIVVYESDCGATLAGYEDEFNKHFEHEGKAIMHNYIFNNKGRPAAMWLNETNFQIETIKMVVHRILLHLPYYRRNKEILDGGLEVTDEIGPQGIYEQLIVFSCASNKGCQVVYKEIQSELVEGKNLICNVDFEQFLERINELPSHRAVLLLYLNKHVFDDEKSYFKSQNCKRELRAAFEKNKPLIVVYESDRGATLSEFEDEFSEHFENEDKAIMHNYVFNNLGRPAAMWLNETNFQIETIKMVVHRILLHLPYYRRNKEILDGGLEVTDEIGPQGIYEQLIVFSCTSNKGCQVVYDEIQSELAEGNNLISNVDFEEFLEHINELPSHRVVLLLYLNKDAFDDEKSGKEMRTSVLVKKATDFGIQLVLMHEQDPEKGACPFNDFFQLTPSDLLDKPYNIYNTLAIPLHASLEHRRVSLRCILRSMGSSTVKNQDALSKLAISMRTSSGKSFLKGRNSSRELKGVWKDLKRFNDEVTAKHNNIRMEA
eukprot:CAMPEP_0194446598 /NCGR_PEP_ID=MMETSP0176-20130528/128522_1 /TAXON_ID=216777 /ORGANISM="Proboscia alata, Strain PI-D3" /LENGTH=1028 /DNA_ID=CAMNT_0039273333 /DNA_START=1712 /DNA_END=4799 /DNA_ORIENTATION=+